MKEIRIVALMIVLTGIRAGLILGGILPPLSVNSSVNTLFLLAYIAIIGYTGWIISGIGFKEAAKKGGICSDWGNNRTEVYEIMLVAVAVGFVSIQIIQDMICLVHP